MRGYMNIKNNYNYNYHHHRHHHGGVTAMSRRRRCTHHDPSKCRQVFNTRRGVNIPEDSYLQHTSILFIF